jgi:hypothetical protein
MDATNLQATVTKMVKAIHVGVFIAVIVKALVMENILTELESLLTKQASVPTMMVI